MSSHKDSKVTDRLFWAKGDKEFYDSLEEQETFFKNKLRKEQFMFALAFGYYNQARAELVNYDGMFNSRDLTPTDRSILESIVIQVNKEIWQVLCNFGVTWPTTRYGNPSFPALIDSPGFFLYKLMNPIHFSLTLSAPLRRA